jgi:hypothetical protein
MATGGVAYGTYTAMTVTNLQSLANDSTDPFGAWQSARVSNVSTLAQDYEIIIDLSTAATAPANDQTAYLYVIPWTTTDGGTTWIAGANFGTTTLPTGSEGTASISEPNSMEVVPIPYKTTSQRLNKMISVFDVLGFMPDGWSLAIRDCTGAALGTGCVVSYRTLNQTI